MKNSEQILFKEAAKAWLKYADIDAASMKEEISDYIQKMVANASTSPEDSGIMPFLNMLKEDQATLAVNVHRDGNKVTVSAPTVNPSHVAGRYANLSGQIAKYLNKNLELFTVMKNGEDVDYDNFNFTLNY